MDEFYQSLLVYSQIKKWQSWVLGMRKDCYIEAAQLMKSAAEKFEEQSNFKESYKCFKLYISINKEYINNINISFEEKNKIIFDIINTKLCLLNN